MNGGERLQELDVKAEQMKSKYIKYVDFAS